MIKNKHTTREQHITIWFGYGLFALMLIGLLLTTVIPFAGILSHPGVRVFNVVIMLIALVGGAILASLISYVIGDRATHEKNKTSHHYNGILFGIAAYWLTLLASFVGFLIPGLARILHFAPVPYDALTLNAFPIVFSCVVLGMVALTYVKRHKNKQSVLSHRPYQIVLITSIAIPFIYQLFSLHYGDHTYIALDILNVLLPLIIFAVAYVVLHKAKTLQPVMHAVIVMSIGMIAATFVGSPFLQLAQISEIVAVESFFFIFEAVFAAVYLALILKKR